MNTRLIQNCKNSRPLKALFDTSSERTMLNYRALPKGAHPKTVPGTSVSGIHNTAVLNQEAMLHEISFPEITPTQQVPGPIRATMFKNEHSAYDIIIGLDVMIALGINVSCIAKTISWNGNSIPFRPSNYFDYKLFPHALAMMMQDDLLDEVEAQQLGYKSKTILHSKYEAVNPALIAEQQKHLTASQRQDLAKLFAKFDKLFSGKL